MPRTSIDTHDPVSGERLPVASDECVLWSSGRTTWEGLVVEQHSHPGLDTPEFEVREHTVGIQLSPAATIEHKSNGSFKKRFLQPGTITLLPARTPVQLRTRERYDVLVLTLSPEMVQQAAAESHGAANVELLQNFALHDAQVEHIGMALKAEAEAGYLSGRLYGESLGTALAIRLLAEYSAVKPDIREQKGGIAPQRLRRVLDYIHANLAEDVRLSALAEVAGLSPHRFAHNFKHSTGLSPHQYVIRERVELAKRMLRETDMTITAVAYALGCGSPSRLTLLFHRATGVTPSVYRASFK